MKTLLLTAALTLTFSNFSQAMTLEDPNNIMTDITHFNTARSFQEEFRVGDKAVVETNACWSESDQDGNTTSGCDESFSTIKVTSVNSSEAYFGSHYAISKAGYEALDRNPMNLILDNEEFQSLLAKQKIQNDATVMRLDSYVESYSPTLNTYTMKIKFTMVSSWDGNKFEIPMYIVLAQGIPFAGQLAEFSIDPELVELPAEWKPSYRVIDWVKFI